VDYAINRHGILDNRYWISDTGYWIVRWQIYIKPPVSSIKHQATVFLSSLIE